MAKSDDRIILIDADVISHFLTAREGVSINKIFPNKIFVLDKVHAELQRWPSAGFRQELSILFQQKILRLMDFPESDEVIKKEYLWIKSKMFKGDGESACLAVARHNKHILASSNLRDISSYCVTHKIDYLTTMDFLCEAMKKKVFTMEKCNEFISAVLKAKSKLPVTQMSNYICRELIFL